MSTPELGPDPNVAPGDHSGTRETRCIQKCNFRIAGHLSNEDTRSLTAIHEAFVRSVSATLDTYLGTGVTIKLDAFEQGTVEDHVRDLPNSSQVIPFANKPILLEFDDELVFPIVDLLMGGTGVGSTPQREVSEIDAEIMRDVFLLIARDAHSAWKAPGFSLSPGPCIKVPAIHEYFARYERLAALRFSMQVGGASGSFRLVFSIEFIKSLMKQIRASQPAKAKRLWEFKPMPLRERILESEIEVTTELPKLRVSVRDLIALQPGSVLKLRAPIRTPGRVTAGGWELFEAMPVRNGSQRAAQVGLRVTHPQNIEE